MMLSNDCRVSLLVLAAGSIIALPRPLAAQGTEEKPIVTTAASAKFGTIRMLPHALL